LIKVNVLFFLAILSLVSCSDSTEDVETKDSEQLFPITEETKYTVEWFTAHGTESEEHVHEGRETIDGGYIAIGHGLDPQNKDDILVIKVNSIGRLVWKKSFGVSGFKGAGYCINEDEEGYFIGGALYDPSVERTQRFLAKINFSGTLLWEKYFKSEGIGGIRSIDIVSEGNIILTGYVEAPDFEENRGFIFISEDSKGFLMKVKRDGDLIWEKELPISQGTKVRYLNDGYAVISSTWRSSSITAENQDFTLIKLNLDGEILWEKYFGGVQNDHLYDFDLTNDEGFILGGHSLSYGVKNWDYLLMKIDKDGNEVWHKTFGQPRGYNPEFIHDEAYGVRQTSDGGFVIVGGSGDEYSYSDNRHFSGSSDEWKVYLVKTDSDGNKEWEAVYPQESAGNNAGEYLTLTSDGGVIIFVDTDSEVPPAPNNFGFLKLAISP
tara:strand:- start:1493 stop:2800 length:1308 start_codon:yes stop_codon:yes gene_type:complete